MHMIPFKDAHLDLLEISAEDRARYGDVGTFMDNNPLAGDGHCFTLIDDGRILVVGGIMPYTKKTGYGWTFVSKHAAGAGLAVARIVKRQLEQMMETMEIHRIATANLKDATEHHRWCRLLGFREEGPLWQYDDEGRDYIGFAKLRDRGI